MTSNDLSFEQTIDFLKFEAENNDNIKANFGPEGKLIYKVIISMSEDLKKAMDGEEIIADKELISDLQKLCIRVLTTYLTKPFEEREKSFFYHFATLCFNWTQAANVEEGRLVDTVNSIIIAINMHSSCINAINSIKMLTEMVDKYLRFNPPAYNISRAYLTSLYSELEEGKLK